MAEPEDTAAVNQSPVHGPSFVEPSDPSLEQVAGVMELEAPAAASSTNFRSPFTEPFTSPFADVFTS